MIQAFIPNGGYYFGFNSVSWYLSLTLFFVLVAPFLKKILKRFNWWESLVGIVLLIALECGLYFLLKDSSYAHWALYIFPPTRLIEFIIGALAFNIYIKVSDKGIVFRNVFFHVSLVIGLALSVITAYYSSNTNNSVFLATVWIIPSLLLLICATIEGEGIFLANITRNKVFVYIGNISFYVFLIHQLIIRYDELLFNKLGINVLYSYIVSLALTAILAFLLSKKFFIPQIRAKFKNKTT